MTKVGIIPNLEKRESLHLARKILKWLLDRGHKGFLPQCAAALLKCGEYGLPIESWPSQVDFVIVLGGDGTLLGSARYFGPKGVPILGVNLGRFGFLTEVETENLFDSLPTFLSGFAKRDERLMLSVCVVRYGHRVFQSLALNEACVTKGPYGRLTVLSLRIAGKDVDTYFADGIIVATPTGSTAYSLSAGGPLMAPQIEALLVTPVCAHTLYSRSIVVPSSESCEIEIVSPSQSTMLSLDGQEFFSLKKKDKVVVCTAPYKVILLRRKDWCFYDVLRNKMKEGPGRLPR